MAASEKKGGRKKAVIAQPGLQAAVEEAVADQTAGSPMNEHIRWTNRSPAEIAAEVTQQGFSICVDTVRRILTEALGLRRRQAVKDEAAREFPQRDEQFQYIAQLRRRYERRGWPVISVDTKKKELLGEFFRPGRAYTDGVFHVRDHDFVTSEQRLVPYGVFDTVQNEALLLLARGADTSQLACDAIWRWWRRLGQRHYWHASGLLLLCDCGGSNGIRHHRFKEDLCDLAVRLRRDIEVAHYPPGCSKYNPIEHRLFCHVTRSLRSVALRTMDVAKELIAHTTTAAGLKVVAEIARRTYHKGRRATATFLDQMPMLFDRFLPQLNYTAPAWSW
ncbi:MAG TPA: ISAzo13 family transposase [Pirellulales bacterium]|nr:ISAzo13 family transposase [Pirellulales bacterium]